MAHGIIVVEAVRDVDARVWFTESSDLPGLHIEAESLEELVDKLPAAIEDLLAESTGGDGDGGHDRDVAVELIAHASTRVRIRAAA